MKKLAKQVHAGLQRSIDQSVRNVGVWYCLWDWEMSDLINWPSQSALDLFVACN